MTRLRMVRPMTDLFAWDRLHEVSLEGPMVILVLRVAGGDTHDVMSQILAATGEVLWTYSSALMKNTEVIL